MIKIQNNTGTREPLPAFLIGLKPKSLLDLSWTDAALGVRDSAWWPEESGDGPLPPGYKWGLEALTLDKTRKVVVSTREAVPMSAEELTAYLDAERKRLTDATTQRRWQVETGGVYLPDGTHVFTGTDDQNRITSVIANAAQAGVESVDFKAPSGWVTLTLAEMQAVASVIALHVQACFTAERAHHEAIALLDAQGLVDYDIELGWPSTTAPT